MTEPDSTEMEIYSGVNDRPEFLIRFPVGVTAEQVAEFEERWLFRYRAKPSTERVEQVRIAIRDQLNGIPDSRWCGNASCDLNGMEHGHGRSRHPVFKPAPIDVSWLTTEPAKPVWPVWLGIAVVGGIPLAVMFCVVAIAVLVKP